MRPQFKEEDQEQEDDDAPIPVITQKQEEDDLREPTEEEQLAELRAKIKKQKQKNRLKADRYSQSVSTALVNCLLSGNTFAVDEYLDQLDPEVREQTRQQINEQFEEVLRRKQLN